MRNPPTYLSLFSGIGGLDLGLDRAGFRCVGQVERDPFCQRVLAKHWPEVPRHDDVETAVDWWLGTGHPAPHLVAGGSPCQPVSNTGRRLGEEDERWLWPAMANLVATARPVWVVVENVPGLRTKGLSTVLADLRGLGYRARTGTIRACEMGAPHPRERLFILAHAESYRRWTGLRQGRTCAPRPPMFGGAQPAHRAGWPTEPRVARVAHGVPAGVDRRRALGNAVVPAVGEHIGRLIRGADDQHVRATRPYPGGGVDG